MSQDEALNRQVDSVVSSYQHTVKHHQCHVMNDSIAYSPTIWVVEDDGHVEPPYPGIGVILTNGAPPVLPQGFTATKVEEPNDLRNSRCHDFNGECQIDDETLGLFAPISGGLQSFRCRVL
jgi:hypothetical protein